MSTTAEKLEKFAHKAPQFSSYTQELEANFRRQSRCTVTDLDGTKRKIGDLIKLAVDEGSLRNPQNTDVIVHPEFAFKEEYDCKAVRRALEIQGFTDVGAVIERAKEYYAERIRKVLNESDNPVVITYSGARNDYVFPYDETITVKSWLHNSGLIPRSELPQLLKLLRGVNPRDNIRIHGSNFGQCPTRMAEQLYALTNLAAFYGPKYRGIWKKNIGDEEAIFEAIDKNEPVELSTLIAALKLFEKSGIRFGILFDGAQKYYDHDKLGLIVFFVWLDGVRKKLVDELQFS